MELFRLNQIPDDTTPDDGHMVNGYTSARWTERYRDPSDFEIQAPLSSGLRTFLPIGSYLGNVDSTDLMIVENHSISESVDLDPVITITGRGIEVMLEERVVGVDQARATSTVSEYDLAVASTWDQAVTVINDHIVNATSADDSFGDLEATALIFGGTTPTQEARAMAKGPVHKALMEILAVDDLGIRTFRYSNRQPIWTGTRWIVHDGSDVSDKVIFSWKGGDLDGGDYLWSDRKRKNAALVIGRYVQVVVDTGPVGVDRRYMVVDGSDLDGHYSAKPTGASLTWNISRMQTRGRQAIQNQNLITLARTDVSSLSRYKYREDYNVGEWVMVDGNYGEMQKMRVVEYTEIQDENGESGQPTLSAPGASII